MICRWFLGAPAGRAPTTGVICTFRPPTNVVSFLGELELQATRFFTRRACEILPTTDARLSFGRMGSVWGGHLMLKTTTEGGFDRPARLEATLKAPGDRPETASSSWNT